MPTRWSPCIGEKEISAEQHSLVPASLADSASGHRWERVDVMLAYAQQRLQEHFVALGEDKNQRVGRRRVSTTWCREERSTTNQG